MNEYDAELRGAFDYALQLMSSVYTGAFTQHGPFTLFLATDAGFHKSLSNDEVPYSTTGQQRVHLLGFFLHPDFSIFGYNSSGLKRVREVSEA